MLTEVDTWYRRASMSTTLHQACILLGSNIEPEVNLPNAVALLQEKLKVLQASSAWVSPPVKGCYPEYLNMALLVVTALEASQLKEQVLRPLETRMGRVRTEDKNAPRPIDLDIIIFDGVVTDPALWQHAYRAIPVAELYPDMRKETGETLKVVARQLARSTPIKRRKDISIILPSQS